MSSHLLVAATAHKAGRLEEAERLYRRVLRAVPEQADALHGLGIVQHQLNKHSRALGFFTRAQRAGLSTSQLYNNRANALSALGRLDEAADSLRLALALAPGDAALHYNLGNTLMAQRQDMAALDAFTRAVSLNPTLLAAWQNKGVVETRLGLHEAALATCDHLIALQPGSPQPRQARSEALLALRRPADAVADLEAVSTGPGAVEAQANLAFALYATGEGNQALRAADAALAQNPEFALAHWNAASICLSLGDYARGWREYEWRWRDPAFRARKQSFLQPLWLGNAPLAGRTILLHAEQGFGDAIQFCRYAPMVHALGARVLLQAPAPLLPLLATLAGVDQLLARDAPMPAFDTHCPLMSLPLAFGTRLETVPAETPYLAADPARVAIWRDRLGPARGRRVGLAWSGLATFKGDATRSAPLAELAGLIRPDLEYIAVQKDVRPGDLEVADRLGVRLFLAEIADFADTAALCALMDVVASVDSAPAHVAGALGRPVWLLLHEPAEWRWLRGRTDSPWYPTARLFRQAVPGDWAGLAAHVGDALAG